MPAFTFEKISPAARRDSPSPAVKKQRGVIVQILDRFIDPRAKGASHEEDNVIDSPEPKPSKQDSSG